MTRLLLVVILCEKRLLARVLTRVLALVLVDGTSELDGALG